MSILERIDERLNENFAKGKDAIYLAGYLDTMANHVLKWLKGK